VYIYIYINIYTHIHMYIYVNVFLHVSRRLLGHKHSQDKWSCGSHLQPHAQNALPCYLGERWMSHVTHVMRWYGWVISHTWMSQVTRSPRTPCCLMYVRDVSMQGRSVCVREREGESERENRRNFTNDPKNLNTSKHANQQNLTIMNSDFALNYKIQNTNTKLAQLHRPIFVHSYTYMHVYTNTHTYMCMYVYLYIYIRIYIHIYTYIYTYIHIYMYIHTYMYTYIFIYIHIHIHMYIRIHIYKYITDI